MADEGHEHAERSLEEFRREVADAYRQAEETARERLEEHLARFEERDGEMRRRVAGGEMTEQAYADWRRMQMMTGRRYEQVLDQVAQAYADANQVAVDVLNGKLPEIYAENANYGGWQACEASGLDLSFSLMDADTARHMLATGEAMFAAPSLDVAKDKRWNRRLMASQLTQGIMLGESIPGLAARMRRVTGSNYATAVRTARTAATGAENAGRVASYRRAQGMGIKLRQEWVAALDGRTRHSHRQLDGERREVGEAFSNGCRFPGDPQARYAEVCNCRCTLVAAVDGVDTSDGERWSKLPEGMTYEQWKDELKTSVMTGGEARAELARMSGRGDISTRVNMQKQRQHIEGTGEWEGRVAKLKPGEMQPSTLSIGEEDVQKLVDELSGTGKLIVRRHKTGGAQVKEVCKTPDGRIIGTWRDKRSGDTEKTDRFTIHYSKTATHIVPAAPSWLEE